MSFQSFSKLPPPTRNRPKNLPAPEFIATIHLICEDTANRYDARNHVLSIFDLPAFVACLKERANRSLESFSKQLKFLGFKKHKEYLQSDDLDEQQKVVIKYYWCGKKEEYIAKELDFTEKHLLAMINRATELKRILQDRKEAVDLSFEKTIFWGMNRSAPRETVRQKFAETIKDAKDVVNLAHKSTGDLAMDVQINLDNEISLLRLLAYRQNDVPDE